MQAAHPKRHLIQQFTRRLGLLLMVLNSSARGPLTNVVIFHTIRPASSLAFADSIRLSVGGAAQMVSFHFQGKGFATKEVDYGESS